MAIGYDCKCRGRTNRSVAGKEQNIKAIILSAGEGKRLRPLTENTPKCLLPIGNKPLLGHWLDKCEKSDIDEVLVNGHYLADKVERYLNEIRDQYSFKINFVYEEELLGTGGTIKKNYGFIKDKDFFFCHGDNFTDIQISAFVRHHKTKKTKLSVALFRTNIPRQCGIAEKIDKDGKILSFVEKPEKPKSNLASAAIFIMSPEIVEKMPDKKVIDFSKEILPLYQNEMYGYIIEGFNIDIGTPANYSLANELASG